MSFYLFFPAVLIVILHFLFHPVRVLGMDTSIFYMDEKYALAAFYGTIISFLVGYEVLKKINLKKGFLKWLDIAFGSFFIYLSFDEYFEIHEYINGLFKNSLIDNDLITSLANQSWIYSLSVLILLVFAMFFLKLKHSPAKSVKYIVLGIISFILVIIFEIIGSYTYGHHSYLYFVATEEGMEMIGLTMFLLSVLAENDEK